MKILYHILAGASAVLFAVISSVTLVIIAVALADFVTKGNHTVQMFLTLVFLETLRRAPVYYRDLTKPSQGEEGEG